MAELVLFCAAGLCFLLVVARQATAPIQFKPGPREAGVLRVVTWNLGTGVDAGTRGLRAEDLGRVASVLKGLEPDIVLLQELADRRQLVQLRSRLGMEWRSSISEAGGGRPILVLVREGHLKEIPSLKLNRAHAVEYIRHDGLRMTCVAVHADAFSAEERNKTLGAASSFLDTRGELGLTLLAGDLNLDLGIDQRGDLFSNDEYLDVETYNYLAKGRVDVGLGSGATAEPDRRLDYLLVGEGQFEVLQVGPLFGQRSSEMDHHPLVADLRPLRD